MDSHGCFLSNAANKVALRSIAFILVIVKNIIILRQQPIKNRFVFINLRPFKLIDQSFQALVLFHKFYNKVALFFPQR
jgi:hypothetical protein